MAAETKSKSEFYHGHVKVTGKTWHGKEHKDLIELPVPVTIEGVFHAFKSRHGDAINDGLTVEKTTPEEFQEEREKEAAEKAKAQEEAYVKAQEESLAAAKREAKQEAKA